MKIRYDHWPCWWSTVWFWLQGIQIKFVPYWGGQIFCGPGHHTENSQGISFAEFKRATSIVNKSITLKIAKIWSTIFKIMLMISIFFRRLLFWNCIKNKNKIIFCKSRNTYFLFAIQFWAKSSYIDNFNNVIHLNTLPKK